MSKVYYIDLLGKSFKLDARGPDEFDCWGLCLEMGRRVGIQFPEHFTPVDSVEQDEAIKHYRDSCFIKLKKPEPYCIAVYALDVVPPNVDHCGFVLEDCRTMIHSLSKRKVSIQRLDNPIFLKRLDGYYKHALNENK